MFRSRHQGIVRCSMSRCSMLFGICTAVSGHADWNASNCSMVQLEAFQSACPLTAVQMPYNMLQRDIEQRTIPWCRERNIAVMVYWPLMKGLLAGKLSRNQELDERDSRRKYPMYQGDEWQKNQDFIDKLREIAASMGRTVA